MILWLKIQWCKNRLIQNKNNNKSYNKCKLGTLNENPLG